MANIDAAFGFRPTRHFSGNIQGEEYTIAANYGTAIYNGQVVEAVAGGGIEAAAAGDTQQLGVFGGVSYTDPTTSKPTWSNYYPAATTPANSEDVTAFVNDDPLQEFMIGTDATLGATLALRKSKVGLTYATTAAAGSTTNGKSSLTLGISTAATTAKQLRLVRVAEDPENETQTAAYCSVIVKVNLHQYLVGSLATGI